MSEQQYLRIRTEEPILEFSSKQGFSCEAVTGLDKVEAITRVGEAVRITRKGVVIEYPWSKTSGAIVSIPPAVQPAPRPPKAKSAPAPEAAIAAVDAVVAVTAPVAKPAPTDDNLQLKSVSGGRMSRRKTPPA